MPTHSPGPDASKRPEPHDPAYAGGQHFAPYLENIGFPKSREAILQVVEESTENDIDGNEEVMARFRRIPDIVYNNIEEVRKALGEEYENYGVVKNTEEKNVQASQTDRR